MKKILYSIALLFTVTTLITACSTTKNASTASNAEVGRGKITGTWTVNSITYEGIVENAVQSVFDQGPASLFQGSTWTLTNSGKGIYALTNGTTQSIFWSMTNTGGTPEFAFKKINEGEKPKEVASGYRLLVENADGDNLTLKAPVQYGGGSGYIVYHMTKK
ncbi:hypothetical protein GZH53_12240 [Flavihumibacter sp. R14]|nr:hypothetical protein [Flavihumibacter soli]